MEIYCYRVVYPSGVFVRVTPDVNGEKTGEVIPCGATFRSRKSLILDGVNYVQLEDTGGWIFSSVNGKIVLELVELLRIPLPAPHRISPPLPPSSPGHTRKSLTGSSSFEELQRLDGSNSSGNESSDSESSTMHSSITTVMSSSSNTFPSPDRLSEQYQHSLVSTPQRGTSRILHSPLPNQHLRMEQKWRDVRIKTRLCRTFDHFSLIISKEIDQKLLPPVITEPGPARSAWMATVCDESERRLSGIISTICGVTRQCADTISDTNQLESHLWILSHLGASETALVMKLLDKAAQEKFEEICHMQRDEILSKANEVCRLSKPYAKELANHLTTLLADDVKNFLQRWIILKVIPGRVLLLPPEPPSDKQSTLSGAQAEIKECQKTPTSRSNSREGASSKGSISQLNSLATSNTSYLSFFTGCEPISGSLFSPQAKSTAVKVVDVLLDDVKSVLSGIWGDPDQQIAHVM